MTETGSPTFKELEAITTRILDQSRQFRKTIKELVSGYSQLTERQQQNMGMFKRVIQKVKHQLTLIMNMSRVDVER